MIKNVHWSSREVPVILFMFPRNLSFLHRLSNFMKTHPVGAELFHVNERRDRHDKAKSHFLQLWNVPKNCSALLHRPVRWTEQFFFLFGIQVYLKLVICHVVYHGTVLYLSSGSKD
jgi:hypothetical protein